MKYISTCKIPGVKSRHRFCFSYGVWMLSSSFIPEAETAEPVGHENWPGRPVPQSRGTFDQNFQTCILQDILGHAMIQQGWSLVIGLMEL